MRKYNENASVDWHLVLRSVEHRLMTERKLFEYHNESLQHELSHKIVDQHSVELFTNSAMSDCEKVFQLYSGLEDLRHFLGMKHKTIQQLKIGQCFDFYNERTALKAVG